MSKAVRVGKKGGKKGGKKKKKTVEVDPNALTEVDRTFYELTITDLNRKLARLRSLTAELEEKNALLQEHLDKLDEDRSDIIAFLKRMLQERSDEITELQERLRALQEARHEETKEFLQNITDLKAEYKQMHEQLTSEIKLLEGKLNSLEEFRVQRDELMKKYEQQEAAMEEQEKRHKLELYEIERKFIIGKDKLKKDMEARLLQLSAEFHDATELRIAATTHRVIRENIAINNELDEMLATHKRLYDENELMKKRDTTLKQEAVLHESEKKKVFAKFRVQLKTIERLTSEHESITEKLAAYNNIEKDMSLLRGEMNESKKTADMLNYKIKILEQNLHAVKCEERSIKTEAGLLKQENSRLSSVIFEAVIAIKEALDVEEVRWDPALQFRRRESLLNQLFNLLSEAENKKPRKPSLDTVSSISTTYARGDLGFIPMQSPTIRAILPTKRNMDSQTGVSLEEMTPPESTFQLDRTEASIGSDEDLGSGVMSLTHKLSEVFFNEEEGEEKTSQPEAEEDDYLDEKVPPRQRSSISRSSLPQSKSALLDTLMTKSVTFIDPSSGDKLLSKDDHIVKEHEEAGVETTKRSDSFTQAAASSETTNDQICKGSEEVKIEHEEELEIDAEGKI